MDTRLPKPRGNPYEALRPQNQVEVVSEDKIRRTVFSKKKVIIPANHRAIVPIIGSKGQALDLPDRDLLFEPASQAFTLFTSVVNGDTNRIMAESPTNALMVIERNTKLRCIADGDNIGGYFSTPQDNESFATRGRKKGGWKRAMMKGVMAAAAAVLVGKQAYNPTTQAAHVTIPATLTPSEVHLSNGVTAYGVPSVVNKLQKVVNDFLPLWKDTGQQVRCQRTNNWRFH